MNPGRPIANMDFIKIKTPHQKTSLRNEKASHRMQENIHNKYI